MAKKFTKYPSNYVKASMGDTCRQLSFDYIITGMHDNDIARHIYEVFEEQHGCTVNGIDYELVDYSDVPEYADADVRQIGVAFTCNGSCNENAILQDLSEALYNAGYEIIGSEFYTA